MTLSTIDTLKSPTLNVLENTLVSFILNNSIVIMASSSKDDIDSVIKSKLNTSLSPFFAGNLSDAIEAIETFTSPLLSI